MTTDRDDVPFPVERLAEDRNWIASTGLSRRHILAGGAFAAGFAAACQPVAASTIQTSADELVEDAVSIPTSDG
ncbi:MAG: carboxymethylenebutenolidase, partial [Sphingobium yanoikuyae]